MISTLIVEDNKITRDYFEEMIKKSARFSLAGTIKDAAQAEMFCRAVKVDLILMDMQTLHGNSGILAAEEIKKRQPHIKIVIVTSLVDSEVLQSARRSGADSLWYKDHSEEELLGVMQKTVIGEHIFPDKSPRVVIGDAWSDELSETQKNILRLYIKGNSYAAIGKMLYIEKTTVKYHMNPMIKKCGFKSKQQLIAAAIDSTIITTMD